jgi:hypothetical protein
MKRIHQDLGFIDLAGNKSGEVVRVYLPADANCLLAVAQKALQESNVCNIILLREIGAMAASLGGVDVLAFTGGIGEHDDPLRQEVVSALGRTLNPRASAPRPQPPGSRAGGPGHNGQQVMELVLTRCKTTAFGLMSYLLPPTATPRPRSATPRVCVFLPPSTAITPNSVAPQGRRLWRQKTMSCSPISRWTRWSQRARLRRNEFGPDAPWLGDRLPTPAVRAPVRATQS